MKYAATCAEASMAEVRQELKESTEKTILTGSMKKSIIPILAVLMLPVSCTRVELPADSAEEQHNEGIQGTVIISARPDADTRAVLKNGTNVAFQGTDSISVFSGTAEGFYNDKFKVKDTGQVSDSVVARPTRGLRTWPLLTTGSLYPGTRESVLVSLIAKTTPLPSSLARPNHEPAEIVPAAL